MACWICSEVESTLRITTSGKLLKYEAGVESVAEQAVRRISINNRNRFIQSLLFKKDECINQKFPPPSGNGNFFDFTTGYWGVEVAVGVAVGVTVAVGD
jgi:hypothetical protein